MKAAEGLDEQYLSSGQHFSFILKRLKKDNS